MVHEVNQQAPSLTRGGATIWYRTATIYNYDARGTPNGSAGDKIVARCEPSQPPKSDLGCTEACSERSASVPGAKEGARTLMRRADEAVAETVQGLGFADQSRPTSIFRRATDIA